MTLTSRITLVTTVAVMTCIAAVAWTIYVLEARDLRLRIDDDLARQAADVHSQLLSTGDVDDVLRGGPLQVAPTYAQFVRADGEVVPLSSSRALLPVDDQTLRLATGQGNRFFSDVEVEGSHVRVLAVPSPNGVLQVARTVDDVDLHLLQLVSIVLLIGGAGTAMAVVVGRLVAKASLRPVRRLVADAEKMASSRAFSHRLTPTGNDELSRLADSLNTLLEALDDSLRHQRQLVADASHELKTPLTGLRTELDLLTAAGALPEADRATAAVDDLVSAVDDLAELARDQPSVSTMDEVALDVLVLECVDWVRRHHRDGKIDVHVEHVMVDAARSQVARAICNLLDNALKHSPDDPRVEVDLSDGVLLVRDHGPGIPAADLPHVFDRFYRAAGSRSLPGAGLGLAIVRKVVDDHGWSVSAENAPDGGTTITLDTRTAKTSDPLTSDSHGSHVRPVDREATTTRSRGLVMDRRWARPRRRPVMMVTGLTTVAVAGALTLPGLASADDAPSMVEGQLERCDDGYCLDGRTVDFGPDRALQESQSTHDFDKDGSPESLADEVAGLLARGTVMLELSDGLDDGDVLTIDGITYRSPDSPPPWVESNQRGDRARPSVTGDREDGKALAPVEGTLVTCGSGYCIGTAGGTVPVDFGPVWWLQTTTVAGKVGDLDSDGVTGTLADEIGGLIGSSVTLQVEQGRDGDDADVHALNGVRYTGAADGPPSWAGGPDVGRPSVVPPGPPEGAGRPEGRPPGPPEGAGRPEGRPPGPPEGAGRPEDRPPGVPGGDDRDTPEIEDEPGPPHDVGGPPKSGPERSP